MHIGEVGEHKYFGIMEDVTAIAKAGQAFRSNAIAAIMRWGTDAQLIDIETNGLLCYVVTLDDYI